MLTGYRSVTTNRAGQVTVSRRSVWMCRTHGTIKSRPSPATADQPSTWPSTLASAAPRAVTTTLPGAVPAPTTAGTPGAVSNTVPEALPAPVTADTPTPHAKDGPA